MKWKWGDPVKNQQHQVPERQGRVPLAKPPAKCNCMGGPQKTANEASDDPENCKKWYMFYTTKATKAKRFLRQQEVADT